ncbi:hypothetical protein GCK72_011695 [Caenorhabditis remanei]|uniref:Uncharacterized protein n=1 Tax=Caenorhabditis remanei TaxID=31234 RepID=A0A6A5H8R0_CAERE|nr:hypothetical protein GCK72_011695 [Caenorhabditis remanei]KAF1763429.1 hypothetical protein GCK72_011695 [Caenorhabditis remanei]
MGCFSLDGIWISMSIVEIWGYHGIQSVSDCRTDAWFTKMENLSQEDFPVNYYRLPINSCNASTNTQEFREEDASEISDGDADLKNLYSSRDEEDDDDIEKLTTRPESRDSKNWSDVYNDDDDQDALEDNGLDSLSDHVEEEKEMMDTESGHGFSSIYTDFEGKIFICLLIFMDFVVLIMKSR